MRAHGRNMKGLLNADALKACSVSNLAQTSLAVRRLAPPYCCFGARASPIGPHQEIYSGSAGKWIRRGLFASARTSRLRPYCIRRWRHSAVAQSPHVVGVGAEARHDPLAPWPAPRPNNCEREWLTHNRGEKHQTQALFRSGMRVRPAASQCQRADDSNEGRLCYACTVWKTTRCRAACPQLGRQSAEADTVTASTSDRLRHSK